jgi:hypothetical protein
MGSITALQGSRAEWVQHYQRMEGKYHIVRHENNTLRAKLRSAGIIK